MNNINQGGLAVAMVIATAYRDHPKVQALMVGGSVARGSADPYSDLEIGVFWAVPPTDDERRVAIEGLDGELWSFTSAAADPEWVAGEHYGLRAVTINGHTYTGLVMVDTNHATTTCLERCLIDVLEHYDTALVKQALIAALQDGIPLAGAPLLRQWQACARIYPQQLAIKMIQENLWCGPWCIPQAYAARDDRLVLYQHFIWMQQSILKILAGLNRVYYRSTEHKWMDAFIERLTVAPVNLAARLKQVFQADPVTGVEQMLELIHETIALVEQYAPEVDQVVMFADHPEVNTHWAHQRWRPQAPYTLLQRVGEAVQRDEQGQQPRHTAKAT